MDSLARHSRAAVALLAALLALAGGGCASALGTLPFAPLHEPTVQNPFPELARVAVAPFFNLSAEPTVDGRQFGIDYYNELQAVPGFEVVPIGVVENALVEHKLDLGNGQDAQRLAQLLGVDAIVVGAVTDYSPYYPQRVGLRVEWYAARPELCPIPAGYGLPLGTREACDLPKTLVYEAEMAAARGELDEAAAGREPALLPGSDAAVAAPLSGMAVPHSAVAAPHSAVAGPRPVLTHTRVYHGNDAHVTEALKTYARFRDDDRGGGWSGYLQRSDDLIRFCCRMHIHEMLTARGGAGETRVVWSGADDR